MVYHLNIAKDDLKYNKYIHRNDVFRSKSQEILIEIYFTCYTDHCFPYKEHSFHLSKWCQVFGKKKLGYLINPKLNQSQTMP